MAGLLEKLIKFFEWFFELRLILCCEFIFIYCVISQMHKEILTSTGTWLNVLLSGKTTEAITMHECYKVWFYLCNKHINPEIKLSSINKVRLSLVLLYYMTLIFRYFINTSRKKDAFALA